MSSGRAAANPGLEGATGVPRDPESSGGDSSTRRVAEELMRTCPNCGTELAERKCKLYCPRPGCGYFLSCADFY